MANSPKIAGHEARQKLGWFYSNRFLLFRRLTQLAVLMLFLCGPLLGTWILKGNYSSSQFLFEAFKSSQTSLNEISELTNNDSLPLVDPFAAAQLNQTAEVSSLTSTHIQPPLTAPSGASIPMTDPLLMLQTLSTGYWPEITALLGAVIVVLFYGILAGKLFCSWVCPFNLITDLAAWLRRKLGITNRFNLHPSMRYFILIGVLFSSAITGVVIWEWVNPVSTLGRSIINTAWEYGHQVSLWNALFIGFGAGVWLLLAIFILDLFVFKNGWCGHLCPMGALYGVIGSKGLIHIDADKRQACTKCMDCINVCPEPQVLPKPLFAKQDSTLISNKECIRCGRCIDVCPEKVFSIKLKLKR